MFALASLSGALAAGAAGVGTVLVYPAYYCLVNFGVAFLLWWRRRALDGQRRDEPVRLAQREAHAVVAERTVAAGPEPRLDVLGRGLDAAGRAVAGRVELGAAGGVQEQAARAATGAAMLLSPLT